MKNVIATKVQYTSPLKINKTYYPIELRAGSPTFVVFNKGTAAAPCRLSFSPYNDIMSLTITGLSTDEIKLSKIYSGSKVVLDGINNTFTIDGNDAIQYFDGWEFPRVEPGENIITITNADTMIEIEIEFQPRYL